MSRGVRSREQEPAYWRNSPRARPATLSASYPVLAPAGTPYKDWDNPPRYMDG